MEARQGRDSRSEARCAARQRDRPCFWAGDAHDSTDQQAFGHTVIKESFLQLQRDIDVPQRWQEDTNGRQPQERRKRAHPLTLRSSARSECAIHPKTNHSRDSIET